MEPEPEEPQLFDLTEPECIPFPDSNTDPAQNGIQKIKNNKWDANFLGNNAASNIEKARFLQFFVKLLDIVWNQKRNFSSEPEPQYIVTYGSKHRI